HLYLEQMSTSQWLLARMARSEHRVYEANLPFTAELDLLDRIDRRRARLERSFTTGLHELKELQKERRAKQAAEARQTKPWAPKAAAPAPPPTPLRASARLPHPCFCPPATTDSR